MADETNTEAKTGQAGTQTKTEPPKKAADLFPRKRHYEDGHVFNFPVSHYELRTEEAIKQSILDGGNSEDQTAKDMDLIREALKFHNTDFGAKIEERKG